MQGVCGTPSGQKVFFSLTQFNHAATPLKSCHCRGSHSLRHMVEWIGFYNKQICDSVPAPATSLESVKVSASVSWRREVTRLLCFPSNVTPASSASGIPQYLHFFCYGFYQLHIPGFHWSVFLLWGKKASKDFSAAAETSDVFFFFVKAQSVCVG